jgi:hypothetical protein
VARPSYCERSNSCIQCIAYLDGRSDNFRSPGGLVWALHQRQQRLLALLPDSKWDAALQASSQGDLSTLSSKLIAPREYSLPPTQGLQLLSETTAQLLTAWRSILAADNPEGLQWPVLVIDYANVLMDWTDEHPTELSQLLNYLKQLTKGKLCHVLLVESSEYHFTHWLQNRKGECL